MIGNLKRITIAVPDLSAAIRQYRDIFGVFVSDPQDLPQHGVQLAMVKLPNTVLELVTPLEKSSPLTSFLKKNPQGGIHHLSYEVADIEKARDQLTALGLHLIGDGTPQPGYLGNPVLFFSPQDCLGVLIQLEESAAINLFERVEIKRIGPVHTSRPSSPNTLEGVEGIGVKIKVDFKRHTPKDNEEKE